MRALPYALRASVEPPITGWSDDVDFLALRMAYGARADVAERCDLREVAANASAALVDQRFEEVVSLTASPIEACPVWAQLHLWRGSALFSLGREEEANVHKRWFLGLTLTRSPTLDLITASDEDGNTVSIYFDPRWHFIRLVHSSSD